MRGTRSSPFSSGITTSVMTRSPSPSSTQRQSVDGGGGRAHLVAGAAERLAQHGADGAVVVGDEDGPAVAHAACLPRRSPAPAARGRHGQQQAEHGAAGAAVALDQAALVGHHLGDQREAEPLPAALGGDEGLEQGGAHGFRDARARRRARTPARAGARGPCCRARRCARRGGRRWSARSRRRLLRVQRLRPRSSPGSGGSARAGRGCPRPAAARGRTPRRCADARRSRSARPASHGPAPGGCSPGRAPPAGRRTCPSGPPGRGCGRPRPG